MMNLKFPRTTESSSRTKSDRVYEENLRGVESMTRYDHLKKTAGLRLMDALTSAEKLMQVQASTKQSREILVN
jgi:hypothetical protein